MEEQREMNSNLQTIRNLISDRLSEFSKMVRPSETQAEGFQDSQIGKAIGLSAIVVGLLGFLFLILSSYGAARLSYCQNLSLGSSSSAAFAWAVTCFMFPGFYYPYYAVFLHNCGGGQTLTTAMTNVATNRLSAITGGFRRRR